MRKITLFAAAVAVFILIGIDAWLSIRTVPTGALARSSTFNPLIISPGMRPIPRSDDYLLGPD